MKKWISLTLAAVLALCMTACGPATSQQSEVQTAQSQQTSQQQTETRTITDATGREVQLPEKTERIVPLGNTPRMIAYLGLADKVVGIGECEHAKSPIMAYAYVNREKWEGLPNVGTDAMGETAYYPEELILAAPDVIFCTYTAEVADDIQKQTGIPVVAVDQGTLFGENYEQSLRLLGEVCGVSDRAEELIGFLNASLEDLEKRTKDIPEEKKPSVLGAGATFKGAHSIDGVYKDCPVFKAIAAKDVAANLVEESRASGVMVDKEQILEWDPDIIFFDSNSMRLINDDYAQNPAYFEQLSAVKNGKLYQWPNSTWHWTNVEIPLVSAYYTGKLLYPEAFEDVDFEQKAGEIFEMFLGDKDYLRQLEEAGAGYGPVTLKK